jgi:hypothetical protein
MPTISTTSRKPPEVHLAPPPEQFFTPCTVQSLLVFGRTIPGDKSFVPNLVENK